MKKDHEQIYTIKESDIQRTGVILAEAFQNDPVWDNVLENTTIEQKRAFFESPVRYGLRYGNVYAPSPNIEGTAVWVPGKYADLTIGRGIRSGSMLSAMKIGLHCMLKMKPIFEPLEKDRKDKMKGKSYIYLMIIGVSPEYQGKGFGGRLLKPLIQESNELRVPIYLETSTERNVRMYQHFGFNIVGKLTHPIINIPQWQMLRESS
ncbi:GNAT family N-acetyltransferase [Marispirochaeta sp.]|jgi:ribosomal protein S18 acetylase RimI-like enzyme|uniref:GNAT family N-acetyltransferase n=1 Tax=Marispirochaeta sp. TaxID=2038653 RepID=UPI0029C6B590|nr:GNAT family N-acetyltransferase [Marispirochaeta sp.]